MYYNRDPRVISSCHRREQAFTNSTYKELYQFEYNRLSISNEEA